MNFAYLTLNGTALGPPNPLQFQFINSGDPQPVPGRAENDTFFMNQGDNITVTLSDTANGLSAMVHDNSNSNPATNTGLMVASAANSFGQIKFQPSGHSCQEIPYTFHTMYSTSSPQTRVLWAAPSYNIAMHAETGHFDFCSSLDADTGTCNGTEGIPGDQEPADGDDFGCFSDAQNTNSSYVAPPGQDAAYCVGENTPGFDGTPYNNYWPDGSSTHSFAAPRVSRPSDGRCPRGHPRWAVRGARRRGALPARGLPGGRGTRPRSRTTRSSESLSAVSCQRPRPHPSPWGRAARRSEDRLCLTGRLT